VKDTGIRMTLVDAKEWAGVDGKQHRREQWSIRGGKIDPTWQRAGSRGAAGWEPSSCFTLYLIDGEIDPRLASYGGVVWPTAWSELFQSVRQGTYQAAVEITDRGLMCRAAALYGASCADADVRLS
jgi:hypothetical protein